MHRFIIVFSTILILVLLGSTAYIYFRTAPPSIGLEVTAPRQISIGVPFPLTVSFSNYSDKVLTDAVLSLTLPDGLSYAGDAQDQRVYEKSMGDVGPGSITKQDVNVIALKDPETLKRALASVGYGVGTDAKIHYQVEATGDVAIGSPAVRLSFSIPEKVLSGEQVTVKLNYENVSGKDYPGLRIRLDYPPMFQKKSAEPKSTQDENMWDFGTLKAGEKGTITVVGTAAGPEQSIMNFSASTLANILGEKYTLNTQTSSVAITASALGVSVAVNGEKDYTASLGENLLYVIRFRNNSNTTLENLTIRAGFIGELFDFTGVQTSASLNSLTNTFTWNAGDAPQLAKLEPGEEGSVSLPIRAKKEFPIKRLGDKNFTLQVNIQAESPTVPSGTAAEKTMAIASIESKMKGLIAIASKGYFRDATAGILNKGPYPPRVNEATQYSIHWQVTNYATDVSGTVVKAFLKSGAKFTGMVKSTIDAKPTYNSASGEVTWQIGNIAATKGVVSAPIEAVFQIEYTPGINQVGRSAELLGETRIDATDEFIHSSLSSIASGITTDLPDDLTIKDGERRVQQ